MEDLDAQASSHVVIVRPVATPSRHGQRGSPGTQSRNMTPIPRAKCDVNARPPSAALSGWEDDSPQKGSDLLEYLGKADSANSGASTPPLAAAITGDLTQALLIARMAAEASSTGDLGLVHKSSFMSQSSGGSYAGRAESKSRFAHGSGSPVNGSGSHRITLPPAFHVDEELSVGQHRIPSADRTMGGGVLLQGSAQASWSPGTSGAQGMVGGSGSGGSGGGEGGTEAERLRGLLYSDDEDDGEDDYQDLMTADDDALFAGLQQGSSGAAGRNGRGPGGRSNRSLAPADGSSAGPAAPLHHGSLSKAEMEIDVQTPSSTGSVVTTASGENVPYTASDTVGGAGTVSVDALALSATASGASLGGLADVLVIKSPREGDDTGVDQGDDTGTSAPPPPHGSSSPVQPAWAPKVESSSLPLESSFRVSIGPATEAMERLLPVRLSGPGTLGASHLGTSTSVVGGLSPRTVYPMEMGGKPEPPLAMASQGQLQGQASTHVLSPNHQHSGQHLHQLHYPSQQYAALPTPQIGEGLRQHPLPARRLYTPGQSNKSPIRGSGFMVTPAAVRSTSPSMSPGRGLHSAVHHHHTPNHHHSATARRRSSPSVALGIPSFHRSRSPRESHASAHPAAITADGEESAPGGTLGGLGFMLGGSSASTSCATNGSGGPGLNGGVLKTGSWVNGTVPTISAGAPAAAGGGSSSSASNNVNNGNNNNNSNSNSNQSLNLNQATLSRFPLAHVQNFPGCQVYRSTPINQVAGSSSDEIARMEATVASPGVAAGPSANTSGQGAARGSGSPGRISARTGRQQPRAPGPSSSVGPAGPSGSSSGNVHDRFGGSYSAPARPSTSPHKPRSSGARSSGLVSVGALSATAPSGLFATGVTSEMSDGPAVSSAAAIAAAIPTTPRGIAVPALPTYPTAHGIRHCGFKQSAPPGSASGGGGFGSLFSTHRHKAAASEDRMRSVTLSKIFAGAAVTPGANPAQQDYPQFHSQYGQLLSPRGSGDPFGGGGGFATADAAAAAAAAMAEPFSSYPQHSQSQQQQLQQTQVQRKGSLPHLQVALELQSPAGLVPLNHQHGTQGLHTPGSVPVLALYGRSTGGRNGASYEYGLPAVQPAPIASGVRSLSFDASRRATQRA